METTLQREEKGNGWWVAWGTQNATVSTLDFDGLQTGLTVQRLVSEKPCLGTSESLAVSLPSVPSSLAPLQVLQVEPSACWLC